MVIGKRTIVIDEIELLVNRGGTLNSREKKLRVLLKVGQVLNENSITWAVGASLLLYFKKVTNEFNDIDIMIDEKDVEKVKEILLSFGELQPKNPSLKYKTKHFLEFKVEGVDIDIMAGFTIVSNQREYYFPLEKNEIEDYFILNGISIPLQSVYKWRTYYELMGREEKVKLINSKIK